MIKYPTPLKDSIIEISKLYLETNLSLEAIGTKYGCTGEWIRRLLIGKGITATDKSKILKKRIERLWSKGWSILGIQEYLNIPYCYIRNYLKKLEVYNQKFCEVFSNDWWNQIFSPRMLRKLNSNNNSYIRIRTHGDLQLFHRYLVKTWLGRDLGKLEHIHHCDGHRGHNLPGNLVVMSKSNHHKFHSNMAWGHLTLDDIWIYPHIRFTITAEPIFVNLYVAGAMN